MDLKVGRFILGFLLITTLTILAFNFFLGFVRRFLGFKISVKTEPEITQDEKVVLYDKNGIVVVRGQAKEE